MNSIYFGKITGAFLVVWLAVSPVFADPKAAKTVNEGSGSERIASETMDAIADVLTGKQTKTETTKSLPPGLAKKDKTPPGWDKGKKTGWKKEVKKEEDSPIRKLVKSVFSGSSQKT